MLEVNFNDSEHGTASARLIRSDFKVAFSVAILAIPTFGSKASSATTSTH
jgi:hypothetical protein